MPPTQLFNEGWMLRLVLDWFDRNREIHHPLSFTPDARWYSEALLTSRFLPQSRPDSRAESFTHADAIMEFVRKQGAITNRQARDITGIKSENAVKREFIKLKDAGMLEMDPELKGNKATWRMITRSGGEDFPHYSLTHECIVGPSNQPSLSAVSRELFPQSAVSATLTVRLLER